MNKEEAFKEFVKDVDDAYKKFYGRNLGGIIVQISHDEFDRLAKEGHTVWKENKNKFLSVDYKKVNFCLLDSLLGPILDVND